FVFQFTNIEIILAQLPILTNLNLENRIRLIEKSFSNYKVMKQMPKEYASFGLLTPALVMGRMMDIDRFPSFIDAKFENKALQTFIENTQPGIVNLFSEIASMATAYLKILKNE